MHTGIHASRHGDASIPLFHDSEAPALEPLARSSEARWLVRVDLYRNVSRELATGADLNAALAHAIEQLRRDGWERSDGGLMTPS
jgi:hypothetical protein